MPIRSHTVSPRIVVVALVSVLGAALPAVVAGAPSSAAGAGQTYLLPGTPTPLPLQPSDAIVSPDGADLYVDGVLTDDSSALTDAQASHIGGASAYTNQDEPPLANVPDGTGGSLYQPSLTLSGDASTLYFSGECSGGNNEFGTVATYAAADLRSGSASPELCGALPWDTDGVDVIGSQGQAYGLGVTSAPDASSAAVMGLDLSKIGSAPTDYCGGTASCFSCGSGGTWGCDTLPCALLGDYGVLDAYASDIDYGTLRLTPDDSTLYAITGTFSGDTGPLADQLTVIPTSTVDQTCGPDNTVGHLPSPQRIALTGASEGIALSPDGSTAYVSVSPTDSTAELDVVHAGSVVAVPLHGSASVGGASVAVSPDGSTVYVVDWSEHAVSVVSTSLIGSDPGDYSASNLPPTVAFGGDFASVEGVVPAPDGSAVYVLTSNDASSTIGGAVYRATVSSTPPVPTADLGLGVSSTTATVRSADNARYVITVHNAGPDAATNVVVTGRLAAYLDLATVPRIGQSLCTDSATFTCRLGTLAAGSTVTITLRAVGDAPPSGTVSRAITVHASSDDADSTLGDNSLSSKVSIASPHALSAPPADPAYPFAAGKKIAGRPVLDARVHNQLPGDCPPNVGYVPMGKGRIGWCGRSYCRSDLGSFGAGFVGWRMDPWESGHSGVTRIEVDYSEIAGDQGWTQNGSATESSYSFSDDSSTKFFVFFHVFNLGVPPGSQATPDPDGPFAARVRIKFQHHYGVAGGPGYNHTLYTTPWYTTAACHEGS